MRFFGAFEVAASPSTLRPHHTTVVWLTWATLHDRAPPTQSALPPIDPMLKHFGRVWDGPLPLAAVHMRTESTNGIFGMADQWKRVASDAEAKKVASPPQPKDAKQNLTKWKLLMCSRLPCPFMHDPKTFVPLMTRKHSYPPRPENIRTPHDPKTFVPPMTRKHSYPP